MLERGNEKNRDEKEDECKEERDIWYGAGLRTRKTEERLDRNRAEEEGEIIKEGGNLYKVGTQADGREQSQQKGSDKKGREHVEEYRVILCYFKCICKKKLVKKRLKLA